ncbi:hypothetical protein JOE26_000276 [Rhodococcus coprophilus]|nr:hypothetical protein [Rhodococcus coprophilus]
MSIDVEVLVVQPVGSAEPERRFGQALPQSPNPGQSFGERGLQRHRVRLVVTGEEDRGTDVEGHRPDIRDEFGQVAGTDALYPPRVRHPSRIAGIALCHGHTGPGEPDSARTQTSWGRGKSGKGDSAPPPAAAHDRGHLMRSVLVRSTMEQ